MPGDLDLALRIRADLRGAQQALRQLDQRLDGVARSGRESGREMRRTAREIDRLDDATDRSARGLGRLRSGFIALGGIAAVAGIARIVGDIAESGVAIERLENRFRFAAGSIAAGAEELRFVRAEAERLGIDFRSAADAYSGLLAAAQGTNITVADTREVFLGAAENARVLGLSAEDTRGVLLALEQIVSKGTVSMEELRQQLGERLPGVLQVAASAMGMTVAEFVKAVEAGDVLAEDLLPRLGRAWRENVAEALPEAVDQADAEFQRLGNSIERLKESVARSGLLGFLAEVSERVAGIVDQVSGIGGDSVQSRFDALFGIDIGPPANTPRGRRAQEGRRRRAEALRGELASGGPEERAEFERIVALENEIAAQLERRIDALETGTALQRRQANRRGEGLAALRAELEIARERARLARDLAEEIGREPETMTLRITASAPPEVDEKAEERAQRRITAITERAAEKRLRVEEDRHAASLRAERRALEEIERIARSGLVGEEALERARTEVRAAGIAERDRLLREQLDREKELADERAETLAAGREDLAALERSLLGPYERAVAEINAWRAAQEAAYAAAGLSVEEYARTVEQVVAQRLAKAWEEEARRRERATEGWLAGARRALADYAESAGNSADAAERAVTQGLQGMEDAFVQLATTGKLEFGSLVDSIIADLARITAQRTITGPLSEHLLGFLDDFGGSSPSAPPRPPPIGHSGGIAGALTRSRTGVDPRVFALAPRLHRGGIAGELRPDEVPTILRRGEGVFTPEQMRALSPRSAEPQAVRVELVNRGTPQRVTDAAATLDPREMVVRIVTEDLAVGGDIARSIQSFVPGMTL